MDPNASFPVFIVPDLEQALEFYTEYLGFSAVFESDWYIHLATESGIQIGFLIPDHPSQPEEFQKAYPGDGVVFSIEVEDVDDAYDEATEFGLEIILDIRTEEWGQRHFSIKDPNGIYIDIIQETDPSEELDDNYLQ